ncbi:MAG TPA: hypothetical protein VM511_13790 [Luteolibacter sp.]|nr:hypothetical protein [Luteolibacter sp.]
MREIVSVRPVFDIIMKLIRIILSAAIALLASSCATFPQNRLPKVEAGSTGGRKVPLTYSLTSAHNITGSRTEGGEQQKAVYRKSLVAAAEKSGHISSVKEGKGGVHVDVDMLNHGSGSMVLAFISGFTFTAIPAFAEDNYTLTATARNSSGKTRKYVLDDGVNTIIWLPMIFAMPTNSLTTIVPRTHENMFGNLILQMEKDGFLR